MENIEQYAGLDGRKAWFSGFELPQTFCLGEESIEERIWIPILGTVGKPGETDLWRLLDIDKLSLRTDRAVSTGRTQEYARTILTNSEEQNSVRRAAMSVKK
jgi:hypothetical protein